MLPLFYSFFIKHRTYDFSSFEKQVAQLKIQADSNVVYKNFENDYNENYNAYNEPSEKKYYNRKGEVFYFDPNTASAADWQRLGLKDKTIATIQKYLSKGGHFYKPEDIRKIWGIRPDLQERLIPYIKIENPQRDYKKNYANKPDSTTYISPYKKFSVQNVEINAGDTSSFIALPGIGSKLAQRIITFREKLGGFYSVEQIKETFGLPDSTFLKIKSKLTLSNFSVKKININTASLEEMKAHPYLRYALANAIVQYRTQHGNFSAISDIKKIMVITDEVFNKVSPYLSIN